MTYQISDTLFFKKKKYHLSDELLEKYFRIFPEKKPEAVVISTDLWRGYIATFEIVDNELFVKEIKMESGSDFEFKSILRDVFPENNKFDWYSGLIRIDDYRGRFDNEPKDGFFEFLEIRNGDLTRKRSMNFDELQLFKKEQYEYFIMSEDVLPIYDAFQKNNEGMTEESMNEIISERILYFTNEVYVD